jgi:hypothetical protein
MTTSNIDDIYNKLINNKNGLFKFIFTIIDNITGSDNNETNKEKKKLFDEILNGAHIVIKQNESQGGRQGGKYRSLNSIFFKQNNHSNIISTIEKEINNQNDANKKLYLKIVKFIINGGDNLDIYPRPSSHYIPVQIKYINTLYNQYGITENFEPQLSYNDKSM